MLPGITNQTKENNLQKNQTSVHLIEPLGPTVTSGSHEGRAISLGAAWMNAPLLLGVTP